MLPHLEHLPRKIRGVTLGIFPCLIIFMGCEFVISVVGFAGDVPETASIAWEGTEVSIAAVGFFGEDFFDSFLGTAFGAEDDFTRCPASTIFGCGGMSMSFVVHKSNVSPTRLRGGDIVDSHIVDSFVYGRMFVIVIQKVILTKSIEHDIDARGRCTLL